MKNFFLRLCLVVLLAGAYMVPTNLYADEPNFYEIEYWVNLLDDLFESDLKLMKAEEVSQLDIISSSDTNGSIDLYEGSANFSLNLFNRQGLGNLPFELSLTYKNDSHYDTMLGKNMILNLEKFLTTDEDGNVTLHDGQMGTYTFEDQFFGYGDNFLLGAELESEGGGYKITFKNKKTYHFNSDGRLIFIRDGYVGNQIEIAYDSQNADEISYIVDSAGNDYYVTYSGDRIIRITAGGDNDINFIYTGDFLTQINWEYGQSQVRTNQFEYTGDRLHRVRNELGDIVLENSYDGSGRVVSQFNGEDTNSYVYSTLNGKVLTNTVTNASGTDTVYTFNTDGTVKQKEIIRSGTNSLYKYEYNASGLLENEILPHFNGYHYSYDQEGNMIEKRFKSHIRDADSSSDRVTTYVYHPSLKVPTSMTDPEGNVVTMSYNAQGNILQKTVTSPGGLTLDSVTYTYQANGLLASKNENGVSIVNYQYINGKPLIASKTQGSKTTSYTYDSFDNILTMTLPEGQSHSYVHNRVYELTRETSPEGVRVDYSYDLAGNLLEESRKVGTNFASTQYEYNALGDVTKMREEQSEGNFRETLYSYANDDGLLTQIEVVGGVKTTFEYNETGKVTKKREYNDGKENTTTYIYDKADRLKQEKNDSSHSTYYNYDGYNNLIKKKYPDNSYYLYEYDKNGNISKESVHKSGGALLSQKEMTYNALGNLKEVKNLLNEESRNLTTTFTYDANGEIETTVYPNGKTEFKSYDNFGRITFEGFLNGTANYYSYDKNDNILQKRHTGSRFDIITDYIYDDDDRLIRETTSDVIKYYTYNDLGQLEESQIGNDLPVEYTYDYLGNVLEEKQAAIITSYEYDVHGNMTKVTDPNGNVSEYIHDDRGNIVQHIYPDNSSTSYSYNDKGEKIQRVDALGTTVDYVYDKLGRLNHTYITKGTNVGGVSYEKFEYDVLGRLTYSKNYDSELFFEYDTLSRLTEETNHGKTVEYDYDDLGNRTQITYPDGRVVDYEYQKGERVSEINVNGTQFAEYLYSGPVLSTVNYSNNTENYFSHDFAGRLIGLTSKNLLTNEMISDFSYEYDLKGNIIKDDVREYFYDDNNRLEEIYQDKYVNSNGYNVTKGINYDYDAAGNRLQRTPFIRGENGSNSWETDYDITDYDVNNLNQYTNYTTSDDGVVEVDVDFVYDVTGNLIEDDKYRYYYDYKNRLTKLEYLDTGYRAYSYRYDPLGRRVYREKQTQRVDYYYAGENSILEEWKDTDTSGNVLSTTIHEYINGNAVDDVLARITTDNAGVEITHYYHKNHLGSIVAVTDASGTVVEKYKYDEFGDPKIWDDTTQNWEWYQSPINNTRLFAGREYNTYSKLYYNRARYYAARLGVFISRDPIDIADDVNLYAYVKNRPVMYTDPSGMNQAALLILIPNVFTVVKNSVEVDVGVLVAGYGLLSGQDHYRDAGIRGIGKNGEELLDSIGHLGITISSLITGREPGAQQVMHSLAKNSKGKIGKGVKNKGNTGGTSKTIVNVKVKGGKARVDVEYPTGGSSGNVHIQFKGKGGNTKEYLNSVSDLQKLPKDIRENAKIKEGVKKAFRNLKNAQGTMR